MEFLYSVVLTLLLFSLVLIIFFQSQNDLSALSSAVEAKRVCHAIAGQISVVAAAGDGTAAVLRMPDTIYAGNYTVFVSAPNRSVSVSYQGIGGGCRFTTTSVSNGTSGRFYINKDTAIRNVNGVVVIG